MRARRVEKLGTVRSRSAWGVADQAISSLSNLIVLILVARSVNPAGFGAFAIAFEVYLVTLFIGRGMSSDVLVTAHASDMPAELKQAVRAGATVMFLAGSAGGLVVGIAGLSVGGVLGSSLVALAFLLPGLLIQDFMRSVFIVRQRPVGAFALDALWLLIEIPVLIAATERNQDSVVLLALWGGCGVAVGVVGLVWCKLVPTGVAVARTWLTRHLSLWPYFVLDNLVFRVTILVVMAGLTVASGLAAVAGLRAATAVFSLVGVLGRGLALVAVPELARRAATPTLVRKGVNRLAWVLTPIPLVLAAFLMLAPDGVGRALFGESWDLASPLILLTAISAAGSMYVIAVAVGLRAFQAARAGLKARTAVALLVLVAALIGSSVAGAYGAAFALAVSSPFQVAVWWWQLRCAERPVEAHV